MAIRVEGSSSVVYDSRWNRIAASSAKCKENKARWSYYQGQANFSAACSCIKLNVFPFSRRLDLPRRHQREENMENRPTIYINYSRHDEEWKDRLLTHLQFLEEAGRFSELKFWSDRDLDPGDDWLDQMKTALSIARAAIFLVSPDFLTSKFIQNEEVPYFLKQRAEHGLRILPIIIRPCNWRAIDWLARLLVLPRDTKPLSERDGQELDSQLDTI